MREYFSGVGSSGAESHPEMLFHAWQRKELEARDYFIQSAIWVAENLDKYVPRQYPTPSDAVRSYVHERRCERPLDLGLYKKLGIWTLTVRSIQEQNDADASLILWAKEKCEQAGLTDRSAACGKMLELFHQTRFPIVFFGQAILVQAMDCREKEAQRRTHQ